MGRPTVLGSPRRTARRRAVRSRRSPVWYHRARAALHRMRRRRVTSEQPGSEDEEASPSKRRSIGERVGAAVSRIEAAEAAASQVERVADARPVAGQESPEWRWCAFCGQPPNRASRGSRNFIDWKLCRVLRDANGEEIRRPPQQMFPVLRAPTTAL